MKFWTHDKKLRRTWPAVKSNVEQWDISKAHLWCKNHDSDGRFYWHYTNTRWWFEKEEDAMMFALKWGVKK